MKEIVLLSLVAGLGTCLGAFLVMMLGYLNQNIFSFFLGLATGIMLAVIILDLIPYSLRYGQPISSLAGFLVGVSIIASLDYLLKQRGTVNEKTHFFKTGYLIAIGIALHDLPEGLAIAAGFAATTKLGFLLVLAIGLHNIPEGIAIAAPLSMGGMSPRKFTGISALVSLFTPLGTILGIYLTSLSSTSISPMLSFAAGAMSYIVLSKLIPESRRYNQYFSYLGIFLGISLILTVDFIF